MEFVFLSLKRVCKNVKQKMSRNMYVCEECERDFVDV